MRKQFLTVLFTSISMLSWGQSKTALSSLLWSRVESCYSYFEEDDEGLTDFEIIDDSKNGYLKIWGQFPTCGCFCSSTVGAYKNSTGDYTFLQTEEMGCSWEKKISSSVDLKSLFPEHFDSTAFFAQLPAESFENPIFYVDVEIPRIGTRTTVTLKLLPFGLNQKGSDIWCYNYSELTAQPQSLEGLLYLAQKLPNAEALNQIMAGDFNNLEIPAHELIEEIIADGHFKSNREIQSHLIELHKIYHWYLSIENQTIILDWDPQKSRFFVVEKGMGPNPISFRDFLIENQFWRAMC